MELCVDNRERAVIKYSDIWESNGLKFRLKQMTIGDYALVFENKIIAVFERKTYTDYASSISDGRHSNVNKLLNLREECGCDIYYIIEGSAFPSPTRRFNNITYSAIESSIFHLMARDKIFMLYSKNNEETAKLLVRFSKSMLNMHNKLKKDAKKYSYNNIDPKFTTNINTFVSKYHILSNARFESMLNGHLNDDSDKSDIYDENQINDEQFAVKGGSCDKNNIFENNISEKNVLEKNEKNN